MDATIQPDTNAKEKNACAGKDGAPAVANTRAYYTTETTAHTTAPTDPYA